MNDGHFYGSGPVSHTYNFRVELIVRDAHHVYDQTLTTHTEIQHGISLNS